MQDIERGVVGATDPIVNSSKSPSIFLLKGIAFHEVRRAAVSASGSARLCIVRDIRRNAGMELAEHPVLFGSCPLGVQVSRSGRDLAMGFASPIRNLDLDLGLYIPYPRLEP